MSSSLRERNVRTIAEFRSNHGRVGGDFEGAPVLLLHHIGARSGEPRVNPMMYLKDGNRYIVFAAFMSQMNQGGDGNRSPDWYYNLKAHPDAQIEVGDEMIDVRAKEVTGAEHDRLYARQGSLFPSFTRFQSRIKRVVPVVALTPTGPA